MATKCPQCGKKLTLLDWRQTCPGCGTNLMFHGFEERFFEDAKNSELGLAKVRVWWAKVLACLFGGKLQIMRLIFMLLPVAALLLPFATLYIRLPLYETNISLGLIGAIGCLSDGTLPAVLALRDAPVAGAAVAALAGAGLAFAGALLCAALALVFTILCFLHAKRMPVVLCLVSVLGAGFAVYGIFAVNRLAGAAAGYETLFAATKGYGMYALLAAFAAVLVPNALLVKKGITVQYKEGDLYRVEIAGKVKRGEIALADLPQPIFETEEERVAREKAIEDTVNGVSPENDKEAARA